MFDVGFSEICLVGLVSLLVIGPEKLPQVARIVGFWLGKARNMVATVQQEIKAELHAEEVRQIFNEQSALLDKLNAKSIDFEQGAQQLQSRFVNAASTLGADSDNNPAANSVLDTTAPALDTLQQPLKAASPTHSSASKRQKSKQRRHGKK